MNLGLTAGYGNGGFHGDPCATSVNPSEVAEVERIALGKRPATIGALANTHGALPAAVLDALWGCDLVVHAGDIGENATLAALAAEGPLVAVRGNSDRRPPFSELPDAVEITVGATRILAVHNHAALAWSPAERGFQVVISGLWHQPSVTTREGVMVVSPGSAAPGWPGMPVSIARVRVSDSGVEPTIVRIEPAPTP
ncbi:MAG: YfcE family phosphodiesterase [Candidatus Eisenbacteria bacterium]|jgi:hypothetical protein|nr:YfcE family phosphodiesterase [Candidatus Eisenbacteria bacterium]